MNDAGAKLGRLGGPCSTIHKTNFLTECKSSTYRTVILVHPSRPSDQLLGVCMRGGRDKLFACLSNGVLSGHKGQKEIQICRALVLSS